MRNLGVAALVMTLQVLELVFTVAKDVLLNAASVL